MRLGQYYGAGMIPYTKDPHGEIHVLLEKRADDHTWAIPGGALDDGEDYLEAAIRETLEETGIHISSAWYVTSCQLPYFSYWVYASKLGSQETPVRNYESEEIAWFSISNLPDDMNFMTKAELRSFLRKEKRHVE